MYQILHPANSISRGHVGEDSFLLLSVRNERGGKIEEDVIDSEKFWGFIIVAFIQIYVPVPLLNVHDELVKHRLAVHVEDVLE